MYINKIEESSSADLFFEVMARFNNRDSAETIKKFAGWESSMIGRLSRITNPDQAVGALKHLRKGAKPISNTIEEALVQGARKTSSQALPEFFGVSRLIKGATEGARKRSFIEFRNELGKALDNMLINEGRHIDDYVDAAGKFKPAAVEDLLAAGRRSGKAVSDEASDEMVNAILSGKAFNPASKANPGPVQRSLEEAAAARKSGKAGKKTVQEAFDEAKLSDDAIEASRLKATKQAEEFGDGFHAVQSRTTGEWTVARKAAQGVDDVADARKAIKDPGPLGDDVYEAARQAGSFKHVGDIQILMRGAKSKRVAGTAAAKFKNAFSELDEAVKIANKITPEAVRQKVLFHIESLRTSLTRMSTSTGELNQTVKNVDFSGAIIEEGAKVNVGIFNRSANELMDGMDAHFKSTISALGQVKKARKGLNVTGDAVSGSRGAAAVGDTSATGGKATNTVGDINQTVNIDAAGVKAALGLGDEVVDGISPAMKAYLDANQAALQKQINFIVNNGNDLALELKNLRLLREAGGEGAAAAGKLHDDFVKVIQRMENIGNVNISGKLLAELAEAGVKVGPKQTSWWGKLGKVIAYGGLITAGAAGGHYLYNKLKGKDNSGGGYNGTKYGPDGDHDGDGILNRDDPDWPGNRRKETGRPDPYIGVTDPAARESLAQADPRSGKYDPRNGWQAANNTIMNLEAAGSHGELNAYLNALQLAYRKRFRMKLNPPFVVPGSSVPLYYAFLNQHRAPAPNLSDPTGRTLKIKEMVLNDGLSDPEGKGPVQVFDVNYSLMNNDAQRAINYTAEETVAKGLAERGHHSWDPLGWFSDNRHKSRRRSRSHSMGEELSGDSDQGIGGQRSRRMSDSDRLMIQRIMDRRGSDRFSDLIKLAELSVADSTERLIKLESLANIANDSTNITKNTDNQTLEKKADDFSKSYYKDAVTDLNNTDKILQSYFAGLGGLYDQRLEKRKADFKTLYNVTDETGEDLIHSAHPKEVVVSDSIGRGGLVENGLEQKRQTHGVALSAPTGNYRANYASRHDALKKLVKLSFSS